jgi:hypothetical protein
MITVGHAVRGGTAPTVGMVTLRHAGVSTVDLPNAAPQRGPPGAYDGDHAGRPARSAGP